MKLHSFVTCPRPTALSRALLLWLSLLAWLLLPGAVLSQNRSDEPLPEVVRDDVLRMGLVFRKEARPYLGQKGGDARVGNLFRDSLSWFIDDGDWLTRYLSLSQARVLMELGNWQPADALAAGIGFDVSRTLLAPGEAVELTPTWFFSLEVGDEAAGNQTLETLERTLANLEATVEARGGARLDLSADRLRSGEPVELAVPEALGEHRVTLSVRNVGERLLPKSGKKGMGRKGKKPTAGPLEFRAEARIEVVADIDRRLTELSAGYELLISRGMDSRGDELGLAMSSLRFWLAELEAARGLPSPIDRPLRPLQLQSLLTEATSRGDSSPLPSLATQLADAESLLGKLEAFAANDSSSQPSSDFELWLGGAAAAGDLRLAYESTWDHQLVPFRLMVPANRSQPLPLVVILHDAGGDENSNFSTQGALWRKHAEERGAAILAVNGRGPFGAYVEGSGADVTDALDQVLAAFPIDRKRVFLMGVGMGGAGTMQIGLQERDRFSALASLAGYGPVELLEQAPTMPLFIAQGEADSVVEVDRARSFIAAARQLGASPEYFELAGVGHADILPRTLDRVFAFFFERD